MNWNDIPNQFLSLEQASAVLQIPARDVLWLVDTRQLRDLRAQGNRCFASAEIYRLIDAYKRTQSRRKWN